MTTLTFRTVRRILLGALLVAALGAGALAIWILSAASLPEDAPLARMYRTEADLTALAEAVRTYRAAHGTYPPPGIEGLRLAAEFRSQHVDYFPEGPPPDGWGQPYIYIPHTHYHLGDSPALAQDGRFFAPDSFQLYSKGADGLAGVEDVAARADNITSWEQASPWRPVYRLLNEEYMRRR